MKDEFIENIIFENEKDIPIRNSEIFYRKLRLKYKVLLKNKIELYKRIINYQINKYGHSLCNNYHKTLEEKRRLSINAKARRRYRKNRG